jgi:hypothetical protein
MIATIFLSLAGLYLLCGIIFSVPFVIVGVGKIDPHAAHGTWGFRILILPGATLLWPMLAKRLMQGIHEPPEERNAHRLNAECGVWSAEPARVLQRECSTPRMPHSAFKDIRHSAL